MKLREVPLTGWLIAAVICVRTAVLALMIVALGSVIDQPDSRSAVVAVIAGIAVAAALLLLEQFLPQWLRARQEARWRRRLAGVSLGRGPDATDDDAELISLATESAAKAATYTVSFLGPYLAALLAPVTVVAILGLSISGPIAAALSLSLLLIAVVLGWSRRALRGAGAGYGRAAGQLAGAFLESVRTLGTTLLLNATGEHRARIRGLAGRMRTQVMSLLYRNQLMILVTDGVFGLATTTVAAVLALIGHASGELSLGAAVAVVLLARLLVDPLNRMGRTFYTGLAGRAALLAVHGALGRTTPETPTPESPTPEATAPVGELSVVDLELSRGVAPVLHGISFTVPRGGHLAVLGPSGAGKSSLALALAGLHPFGGRISLGGRDCTEAELRAAVAYVPQSATLFSGTLGSNLDPAGRGLDPGVVAEVLARTNLPAGLTADLRIGETGRGLSGGEAARIAVARGLVRGAEVIILDEATANLDAHNAALLRDTARGLDATLIEITHRPAEALDADRVLIIESGRVSAFGTPTEVAAGNEFFARALVEEL